MSVVVGFHCEVISCELARRSVRRVASAAAAKSSACGRGNMVGRTSIFDVGHYFPCFNYLTYSVASRYWLLCIITFESVMKTRFNVSWFSFQTYEATKLRDGRERRSVARLIF